MLWEICHLRILFLLKSKTLMNMAGIFFEENGVDLLKKVGMTKTEYARRMGIRKQNVNSLFKTKNWVLTAYSKESSDTTQAPPGIN